MGSEGSKGKYDAAWRDATNETAPYLLWANAVEAAVRSRCGHSPEMHEVELRARLGRAYHAGEPVWMAADEFAFRVERARIESAADREVNGLRRMLSGARHGG